MRTIHWLIVLSAVLIAPVVGAGTAADERDEPRKSPWDLTTAERLALRTNPATLEHLRIRPFVMPAPGDSVRTGETFRFRIEGRTHPELLLPFELFRNLLAGLRANADGAAILRESYAPVIARLELPPDLLMQVVDLAEPYLSRETRIQILNERLRARPNGEGTQLHAERNSLSAMQCSALFDALSAARQRFGATLFDRFLYEAVAPGFVVTMSEPDDARELARWEGGCK